MCSRYAWVDPSLLDKGTSPMTTDAATPPAFQPRYNIAPNTFITTIRAENGQRVTEEMFWGFTNPYGKPLINARIETIKEKPLFSAAFKRQRCVMPADCFYEWIKEQGKRKQPIRFSNKTDKLLYLAGIWKDSMDATGRIKVCAICTSAPNSLVAPIHDRMPLALTPDKVEMWLAGGELNGRDYEKFKVPYPAELLKSIELDTYVNNVNHEGPRCWTPRQKEKEEATLF